MQSARLEFLAQIAHWYYEEGQTQEDIARRVNLSRSMVSRLLQEARDQGLVEIHVRYPLKTDSELEASLLRTFDLVEARVLAEPPADHASLVQRLGELGARFLQQHLRDGIRIAVGWGTAIYELTRAMPKVPLRDAVVVQMIGAIGAGDPMLDGPECARWLAQKLGASSRYVHAPVLVESETVARALVQERSIVETLSLVEGADVALTGIGTIDPALSSLRRAGFLDDSQLKELREAGAVGDILAYQLDAWGRILDIPLNRRVIAIDLEVLRRVPTAIAVAGGLVKAPIILAALRGRYVNVLITDAKTAYQVLALSQEPVNSLVNAREKVS